MLGEFAVEGFGAGEGVRREGEDEDLVVGEAALGDGLGEGDAVDLLAVDGRVVHRAEGDGLLGGLGAGALAIDARGGGHIEAAAGEEVGIVVDAGEGRALVLGPEGAGGAVGFVANHKVEGEGLAAEKGLGGLQHLDGLVGGEDDGQLAGGGFAVGADAPGNHLWARGGRQGEGVGVLAGGVFRRALAAVGRVIRADADRVQGPRGIIAPRHECLVEQGDGGDQEER